MQASRTSSFLAIREMNFWVLSLDQVIFILLSIVNVENKFLEDKECIKFRDVMTVVITLFFSHIGVLFVMF
jgi:hypothetical protein